VADIEATLRSIIADVLGVSAARADALDDDSGLFGTLPELDSMAVANLLTEIEDRTGIIIEDDEIDGEMLETFGNLRRFLAARA
jgi:acyl carrier protein